MVYQAVHACAWQHYCSTKAILLLEILPIPTNTICGTEAVNLTNSETDCFRSAAVAALSATDARRFLLVHTRRLAIKQR
jgi:hypothetical protein